MVSAVRIPAAGPRGEIEVRVVDKAPPGAVRIRMALWLLRLAGRLARLRVRVVASRR